MKCSTLCSTSGAIRIASVFLLAYLVVSSAGADMYKWVDDKGVIHFSDQPPAPRQVPSQMETIPTVTSRPAPAPATSATPATEPLIDEKPKTMERKAPPPKKQKPSEVVLYVTSWCKYCKKAKEFLRSRNIAFTVYDIEKDQQAARRRKELDSRSGVPLAIINGQILLGFSEASYTQALTIR